MGWFSFATLRRECLWFCSNKPPRPCVSWFMRTLPLILLSLHAFALTSFAGVALFARPTDTIRVNNNTVPLGASATYEARILFTDQYSGFGRVFNEYRFATEDKALWFGPNLTNPKSFSFGGFSAGLSTSSDRPELYYADPITLNQWHHIAYVYDGSEERLYLDGLVVARRAASRSILNHDGFAAIGSNFRESREDGFVGYIDSLRVSAIARYTEDRFCPPVSDFSSDANTHLLYNFNEPPGSTTATDEGPSGRTGTLGVGQGIKPTAPVFTEDPLPRRITISVVADIPRITWDWDTCFKLQVAFNVVGPFEDVPNATSPFAVSSMKSQQFFRIIHKP